MNTAKLSEALAYESRPSTPDASSIIARGRRRRARYRAAGGTGLAAILAVAALVASNLAGTDPADPPGSTGLPDSPAVGRMPTAVLVAHVSSSDPTIEAPTRFDPLLRTLHVGWVPAGLIDEQAETGPWRQSYGGFDASYVNGGPDVGLVVDVLAKGRPVTDFANGALGLPRDAVERPTSDINGRPAFCLSERDVADSCPALRWQYAPGAWARVSYAGTAGQTPAAAAAVARRVAESVSLTAGEPVRLPFQLTGELATMPVAGTLVSVFSDGATGLSGERWSAQVSLVRNDSDLPKAFGDGKELLIGALQKPDDPSGRTYRDGSPTTTVGGLPAAVEPDGTGLTVWGVHGTRVAVSYVNRPGDARATYALVRVLDHPGDLDGWMPVR